MTWFCQKHVGMDTEKSKLQQAVFYTSFSAQLKVSYIQKPTKMWMIVCKQIAKWYSAFKMGTTGYICTW